MKQNLSHLGSYWIKATRLLVGVSDYDSYVKQHRTLHPDKPVMSYEEFFKNRQAARYGSSKRFTCC